MNEAKKKAPNMKKKEKERKGEIIKVVYISCE